MLIEKLNQAGGLLGRPVEAAIMDPRSDPKRLRRHRPKHCCGEHDVAAIFRLLDLGVTQAVLPVLAGAYALLFYPSRTKARSSRRTSIYTGADCRSRALPAVDHLLGARQPPVLPARHRLRLSAPRTQRHHPQLSASASWHRPRCGRRASMRRSAKGISRETVQRIRKFCRRATASSSRPQAATRTSHFFRERARQASTPSILPVMGLLARRGRNAGLSKAQSGRPHGSVELSAEHRRAGEPRLYSRMARFTGDPPAIPNDPMEAELDWLPSLGAGGRRRRHHRAAQAVRRAWPGDRSARPSGFDVRLDSVNQHLHKPSVIGRMDANNSIQPVRVSEGLIAPSPWSSWLAKDSAAPLKRAVRARHRLGPPRVLSGSVIAQRTSFCGADDGRWLARLQLSCAGCVGGKSAALQARRTICRRTGAISALPGKAFGLRSGADDLGAAASRRSSAFNSAIVLNIVAAGDGGQNVFEQPGRPACAICRLPVRTP